MSDKRKIESASGAAPATTTSTSAPSIDVKFDVAAADEFVSQEWTSSCIPTLEEYIKIPNLSPTFDDAWATNGLMERVVDLFVNWVESKKVPGLSLEVIRLEGLTPLIFIEVEPTTAAAADGAEEEEEEDDVGTVLLYGHMDKQPPFEGWMEGLDPYKPVIKDGKLYGRGGADDGYAIFAAVTAIRALKAQGAPHGRLVLIVEAAEESGSPHLPQYIAHLRERIGVPNLVVCLDSGAGNYEQLWVTNSLRGVLFGTLTVDILTEGVHSGAASGIVPDSFRISRALLSRLEDAETGKILPPGLSVSLSDQRMAQTHASAQLLGRAGMVDIFPFASSSCKPVREDCITQLALNRWWRPQLSIVGAAGLPSIAMSGNVLRPSTTLVLSLRLPPTVDKEDAIRIVTDTLTKDPPYGAKVKFTVKKAGSGWSAPDLKPWLSAALNSASQQFFGKDCMFQGEGGSIPFMGMLGKLFPSAQFCVTGVLGPLSNAHGPNEFLHIDFSRRLTCCIASILASHCASKVDAELRQAAAADDNDVAVPSKKSRGDAEQQVDVSDLILPANERNER